MRDAFHESTHIIEFSDMPTFKDKPILYNKLGIYKMLLASNNASLKSIHNSVLHGLIEFDKENDAELITTLESYIQNNMNLEATSKALYIHSNTIRYRIKKIESITGLSLKNTEDMCLICYCVYIGKYLHLN